MKQKGTLFEQLQQDDEPLGTSSQNNWRESNVIRISVILTTVLLCGLFFPNTTNYVFKTEQNISSLQGLPWQYETIRAEYSFPITKAPDQIDKEKKIVQEHTPPVFTQLSTQTETTKNIARALDTLRNVHIELRDSRLLKELLDVVTMVYSKGLINIPKNTISSSVISVTLSRTEYVNQPISDVYDKISLVLTLQNVLKKYTDENTFNQYLNDITSLFKPNLIYSAALTLIARQQSADNVRKTLGLVRKGEIVVAKGEIINAEIITKMKSYGLNGNYNLGETTASISGILGAILHSGLVYSILILFLAFLRKKIFSNNASLISISSMIITIAFLSWISLRINSSLSLEYLIIIPVFSMLSAIFFDSRTGFTVTVTMALMLAGVRGNDYTTGFAMLLAGT
ncbi:MAG: hypothetical protein JNJ85_06195, partial [Candidatus Kapabacteria bacterium]|nr:hypothetical protein [Candidatus Kapabacteria bacterium]